MRFLGGRSTRSCASFHILFDIFELELTIYGEIRANLYFRKYLMFHVGVVSKLISKSIFLYFG